MLNGNHVLYKKADDEQLMAEIVLGNKKAFSELYSRYSKKVLYYFWKMLGQDEAKAQDFLQDLFMKVVEKPEQFDASRTFSTWLFSCANNMCKNEYKKIEVRKKASDELMIENKAKTVKPINVDGGEFNKQLYLELEKMEQPQRATFLLRHKQGFSIKQISEVLDCSEGTVKSRLFYTTKKLSERLSVFNPKLN